MYTKLKRLLFFCLCVFLCTALSVSGQHADSIGGDNYKWEQLLVPSALISYGVTSICNPKLMKLSEDIRFKLCGNEPYRRTHIDDYVQYAPGLMALGLNIAGVKGKSKTLEIPVISLLSNIVLTSVVSSAKPMVHQKRPDDSGYSSFPSGHTAAAFAGAELLYQEYKDRSVWYGIAGYTCAATTGYFRMYNNRHSLADVLAGAGIGILSTKFAYFSYGKIKHALTKNKRESYAAGREL